MVALLFALVRFPFEVLKRISNESCGSLLEVCPPLFPVWSKIWKWKFWKFWIKYIIAKKPALANGLWGLFAEWLRIHLLNNNLTATTACQFLGNNNLFIDLCLQLSNMRNDTNKAIAIGQFLQGCDQIIL